jgi:Flp pilus assembly protein CpaB
VGVDDAALRALSLKIVYGVLLARCGLDAARAKAQGITEAALITSDGAAERLPAILSFAREEAGTFGEVPAALVPLELKRRELVAWALICRVEPPEIAGFLSEPLALVVDALTAARAELLEKSPDLTDAALAALALDPQAHQADPAGLREGTAPGGKAFTLRAPLPWQLMKTEPGQPGPYAAKQPVAGAQDTTPPLPGAAELRAAAPADAEDTDPRARPLPSSHSPLESRPVGLIPIPVVRPVLDITPSSALPPPEVTPEGIVPLPLALREPPPRVERKTETQWRVPGEYTTARPKGFEPLAERDVVVVPAGQLHRSWRPFVFVSLFAGLAILSAAVVLKLADTHRDIDFRPVLTVRQALPSGAKVLPEMLVPAAVPKDVAGSDAIGLEDLAGVSLQKLLTDVAPGDVLHWSQLALPRAHKTMAEQVPVDARAYALEVSDDRSVGFFVHPGDRVDLIAVLHDGPKVVTAFLAVEDCTVLATGSPHPRPGLNGEYQDVTLLVAPADADRLALIRNKGGFTMTLRGPGDHDSVEGQSLQGRALLDAAVLDVQRKLQDGR